MMKVNRKPLAQTGEKYYTVYSRVRMGVSGPDSSGRGWRLVAGRCEHGDELQALIRCGECVV